MIEGLRSAPAPAVARAASGPAVGVLDPDDVVLAQIRAGLHLDPARNEAASGEALISSDQSRVQAWVLPTNEEIVVARQSVEALAAAGIR